MRSVRLRSASAAVLTLTAASLGIFCFRSEWAGNAELYTLLETVATLLELMAGAIALKGFYATRTPLYLQLGSALLGASLLDACHVFITSSFLAGTVPRFLDALQVWSEFGPRLFLAALLSLLAVSKAKPQPMLRHGENGVYAVVAGALVLSLLASAWTPAKLAYLPQILVHRPAEFIPALLFARTAWVRARRRNYINGFEHYLILSLLAAALGHCFFGAFSGEGYDAHFVCFHLFKVLSFILMLAALFSSVASVYRSEAKAAVQLRYANEALRQRIVQKKQAEDELRRARDELETRVGERTADLEKQRLELKAAHVETELFLTSIPSILIGLDSAGRITRWNPTAGDVFGISAECAIGRTLDNCGICWMGADFDEELRRWLGAKTLYRCDELFWVRDGQVRALGLSIRPIPSSQTSAPSLLVTGADITERRKAEAAVAHLAAVVESSDAAIITVDLNGVVMSWNPAAERVYGYAPPEVIGRSVAMLWPEERAGELAGILERLQAGERLGNVESVRLRKDGQLIPVLVTYSPIHDQSGKFIAACSIAVDITERKLLEHQLAQAQKLESIGQLAAGIAHEINTPIQYVGDNIRFLRESFSQLEQLFQGYDRLLASLHGQCGNSELVAEIEALVGATQCRYLRQEIPRSIEDALDGANRVAEIVRAMKEFSHPGPAGKTPLDINRAIESTVLVSRNEWKYVADVHTELNAELPAIMCVPGEFNQVILNLIVNAAHAIADVVAAQPGTKGAITVTTRADGEWAEIRVHDTGTGIPAEVQPNMFNPFFTTKGVGKGTGQGLAIAHNVIVQKHG
ncbi:MAG TPA: PAS domain S-box protein, partial [Bryobacteraceae bacterium]|nr:PAS domain S-box protein [Bryobacteraceae bacterium]